MQNQQYPMTVRKRLVCRFIEFLDETHLLRCFDYLTRNGLRILCYHSFSVLDLYECMPGMFMRAETFRRRMQFLKKNHYHVLNLEEAVHLLKKRRLPGRSVVITMDDGWAAVKTIAHPICREFGFPYTIYLSSYHSKKRSPVFNMAVCYFFWKTKKQRLNLDELGTPLKGVRLIGNASIKSETIENIISYGKTQIGDAQRVQLLGKLSHCLDVDYELIKSLRAFEFLTNDEIAELSKEGVDFQLHTHRHFFPVDEKVVEREIEDNREYLEPIVNKSLKHFCYPSGIWKPEHLPLLENHEIETATTCDIGFNYADTNPLLLKRLMDADHLPLDIFVGQISGLQETAQAVRKKIFGKIERFES